jgi:hypothetical protein
MSGGSDRFKAERERALRALQDADWDERTSKIEIMLPHHPPPPSPPSQPSKRPSSIKGLVVVLEMMPPWGRVIVMLAIIGAAIAGGYRLGWWGP